jgi:hypothetical protein
MALAASCVVTWREAKESADSLDHKRHCGGSVPRSARHRKLCRVTAMSSAFIADRASIFIDQIAEGPRPSPARQLRSSAGQSKPTFFSGMTPSVISCSTSFTKKPASLSTARASALNGRGLAPGCPGVLLGRAQQRFAGRIDQAGTATAQDSSSASRLLIGFREEHLNGEKLCKTPANACNPMHTDPSNILNSFIREQRKNRSVHQQHVGRPGHEPIEHRAADGAGFYLPAGLPLRDLGRLATEEGVGGWAVRCRFLTSSKYATMLRCTSACCNAA